VPANEMTLADARRRRLVAEMQAAGIDGIVAYGNAWQCDYLRYVADFGILEGHGIAVVPAEGAVELFLDSAADAERAETETPGVAVTFAPDIVRTVGARLDRIANRRLAAAPRKSLPKWLADAGRNFKIEDATALLDRLLMHKLPAEIEAIRRAARLADDAYVEFCKAVAPGRRQFEIVADLEAYLRRRGAPDNFMIIGSGGKDVFGMTPPSERRIAPGDLVTTELTPAVEGYYVQICRTLVAGKPSAAQQRAFAVFREALEAGVAAVKPGATAADVARAENHVSRN
jgi:Xaa-Pro dipeptidase